MIKKSILSVITILSLFGCAHDETQIILNNNSNSLSSFSQKRLPEFQGNLNAFFNNAYKILAVENNEIGHNDVNNSDKYFFKAIESAQSTLDVAFFDIDDQEATNRIISTNNRGVKVRVVTDTDNLKDKKDPSLPRKTIEDLKAAGIEIRDDKRNAFMHHKFMIVDNKAVWGGSMNPTTTSMYEHNNNVFYIQSTALAENYRAVFNRMFEKNQFGFTEAVVNPIVQIEDGEIKTFFSPKGGTQQAIIKELKNAKESIKFMAFSFTEKNIGQVLIDKKKQGLEVEGVFDSCLIDKYSNYGLFKQNNILSLKDGNQALLHHKTMIIDDEVVITGSYNFSNSAENSNNEDTIIVKSKSFAQLYVKEYNKIKYAAVTNKDIPPYDHPACNRSPNVSTESIKD